MDSLHLFLRISDVLINLLIHNIRTLDGIANLYKSIKLEQTFINTYNFSTRNTKFYFSASLIKNQRN